MLDIVIYEEDQLTRSLMQEWLQEAGYRVRVGSSCNAGGDQPGDLVVANVYMPKQRGAECLRAIRAAHPGRPMIAISCQFRAGLDADGAAARALGVRQAVAKPLMRDDLLRAVQAVVGSPT
jgi:two-component system, OmpR family, KDP operon response regulator KdpE